MRTKHFVLPIVFCLAQQVLATATAQERRDSHLKLAVTAQAVSQPGDISIESNAFDSRIRITASTSRFAGAIYSVTFRDKQYINSTDHGRELQSASSFDDLGECFNPTEAGSEADGASLTSSSVPINYSTAGNTLQTSTNMAFWLRPGQSYGRKCGSTQFTTAQNSTIVSGHVLNKTVSIGYQGIPNVIRHDFAFYVPESHRTATFEALTGYMPTEFSVFLSYDPIKRLLSSLSDGPGEQSKPVMFATGNGLHAMGVSSFSLPQPTGGDSGYGRFRFSSTNKWNCVFREKNIVAAGTYRYTCMVAIGSVDEVIAAQNSLYSSANQPAPVFRFFNGRHFLTLSYNEGANAGFAFKNTAFNVYSSNFDGGMVPIYRCYALAGTNHFVSRAKNCEGQRFEGMYGFISASPRSGFVALHRFYRAAPSDHLITTNYSEGVDGGYSYEGVLGYVPRI